MWKWLLFVVCLITPAIAQTAPEGIGQGYDGELKHASGVTQNRPMRVT